MFFYKNVLNQWVEIGESVYSRGDKLCLDIYGEVHCLESTYFLKRAKAEMSSMEGDVKGD